MQDLNGQPSSPAEASACAVPAEEHAHAAGLVYVSDQEPGIRRIRKGRGFAYISPSGTLVKDEETLARIRSLAIPPAYTDVWISPHADGHIQATGRDQRGRKQYRYHARWSETRDTGKYGRTIAFARALPDLRRKVSGDMSKRGVPREKVLATVVSLLDRTLIRVGNEEYAKGNGSYGLTTLQTDHVEVKGAELKFNFTGKSGKIWKLSMKDRRIARIVRSIQELPGQDLFQYTDEAGQVRDIISTDVNGYLREIAGEDISAKDFRTWAGTVMAAEQLAAQGPFTSSADARKKIRGAIAAVSGRLGNTVAVCRKSYVHPQVIEAYLDNSLIPALAASCKSCEGLSEEEVRVLMVLEQRAGSRA